MKFELSCYLIKEQGQIIGISLISNNDSESEEFCRYVIKGLTRGEVGIRILEDKIIFSNPSIGEISYYIDENDGYALENLFKNDYSLELCEYGFLELVLSFLPKCIEEKNIERIELKQC